MRRKTFGKPEIQELHTRLDYVLLGYPKISTRVADTRPIFQNGVEIAREWVTGSYKSVDVDGNVYLVTYSEPINMPEYRNSRTVEGKPPTVKRSQRLIAGWEQFRAVSDERMSDTTTVEYVERKKLAAQDT